MVEEGAGGLVDHLALVRDTGTTRDLVLEIDLERGLGSEVKERMLLRLGEGITGTVARDGEPILAPDVRLEPRYVEANPDVRSEMAVPIKWGSDVVGVINLDHREAGAFAAEDLELLIAFANAAAVALKNAKVVGNDKPRG